MPQTQDWAGCHDGPRLLITSNYTEKNYRAAVKQLFRQECAARGYEVRASLRYQQGLQAWRGEQLVGEYKPNGCTAWVLK